MTRLRTVLALASFALAAFASATGLLIVPGKPDKGPSADPEGNLLLLIADALDKDGRVSPVAWSLSDPIFRAARSEGKVPGMEFPGVDVMQSTAAKLSCDYVLTVTVWRKAKNVFARARLTHKGKEIWVDPKPDPNLQALLRDTQKRDDKGQIDTELYTSRVLTVGTEAEVGIYDTFKSLAQTWAELMYADPLKGLKPRPRSNDPVPLEGGNDPLPSAPPVAKVSNQELLSKVMALMAKGDKASAITMLRDAVDTAPLDAERRQVLVNVLLSSGYYVEAAKQARQAAAIVANPVEMRVLASRAWLAADNLEEAQQDLKEAAAREPDAPSVRMLMGEVSLRTNGYEEAEKHFTAALAKGETGEGCFKLALVQALRGDGGKARANLEKAKKLGLAPNEVEARSLYVSAIGLIEAAALKAANDVKELIQRARKNPLDQSLTDDLDATRVRADSLQLFLKELAAPTEHQQSHDLRVLGIKLVLEAISETEAYLKDNDDDTISDANISLGEGLKDLSDAKKVFAAEISN